MARFFASVGGMDSDGSGQAPSALKNPPRPIARDVPYRTPYLALFQDNVWVTTSGVAWEPAIRFCQ